MSSTYAIAGSGLLKGKKAIVTGASQGIGRAICLTSAAHGADIVIHHLGPSTQNDAQSLQEEIQKMGRQAVLVDGDISDPATAEKIVDAALQAFSRIDILFSNAGICPFHEFLSMPNDLWKRVQGVNLDGSFYITKAVANQMAAQSPQGGSIVAVSSISALVGGAMQTHYTPTKAGIKSLMESCAVALGKHNIRCNSVLPGTIETPINTDDLANVEKRNYMEGRIPLGRLGVPDDIAGPAVFLASDLAKYVTGSSVLIDGGALVNLQ